MKCSLVFLCLYCHPPFFLSPLICVCVCVCVREKALSLMTQKLWRHAVSADGRYDEKKRRQEETNCLQTARAVLTERFSGLSEQIGKVTNCDSVVMSHSLNYTRLYLTSHLSLKKEKKNVMPFDFCKGCTRGSHKRGSLSCLSQLPCIYAAGRQRGCQ